ncbi:hypothetical protein [Pectobacterium polaris]|uniref:hypothetical protein n=1 Tax=Pectobacterium polaris TaxID=2042057 RepID=UPI000F93EBFD|nr:hypothetical protein [Pectobacterium polaris]RUR93707.1 hypothetical protein KHDHEBDM_03337 [Pectobacterium polaris]
MPVLFIYYVDLDYQNEGYIIGEILKEVKEKVIRGKGDFFEILLNDKKIMKIF